MTKALRKVLHGMKVGLQRRLLGSMAPSLVAENHALRRRIEAYELTLQGVCDYFHVDVTLDRDPQGRLVMHIQDIPTEEKPDASYDA